MDIGASGIRGSGRPPWAEGSVRCTVLSLIAVFTLLHAGCTENNFWQPAEPDVQLTRVGENGKDALPTGPGRCEGCPSFLTTATSEEAAKPSQEPPPRPDSYRI